MGVFAIATQVNTGPTSTLFNNNHGAIFHAGNVANGSALADTLLPGLPNYTRAFSVRNNDHTNTALSAGTFAYQPTDGREFILMKSSTLVNGSANTLLQTGSSWPAYRRKVASIGSVRTTFLSGLSWDNTTELPTYTFTTVTRNQIFWSISGSTESQTADDGISSVTNGKLLGELTYRDGSFLPINDQYHTQE